MQAINDFLLVAGGWTFANSFSSIPLILLVVVILFFFQDRLSSRFRTFLWMAVGIRLLLFVAPESSLSLFNIIPKTGPSVETPALVPMDFDMTTRAVDTSLESGIAGFDPAATWKVILAATWFFGVITIIGFAFVRLIKTRRWVSGLDEVEDSFLKRLMHQCADQAGVKSRLCLVRSHEIKGIAIFGFLRPSHLIIPADFSARYTEFEMQGILLHELAHVRRCDLLWNWMTLFVQALHWFNPFVWWAGRKLLVERELACDRFALNRLPVSSRLEYGRALLKTLGPGVPNVTVHPAVVPFLSRKSELKHRLRMIKKSQSNSLVIQACVAILSVAACAVTFTSALSQDREDRERRSPERANSDKGRELNFEFVDTDALIVERFLEEVSNERGFPLRGDRVQAESLQITVLPDGVIIGDKKISLLNLESELDKVEAGRAVITAQPDVKFQNVITVMNSLRNRGIRNVAFAALKDRPSEGGDRRRDGDGARGGERREGARDGARDGERREGARDGDRDGERREGARDGDRDGERREGARDGDRDGERREGARDGDRDGERREGARDGDRDGERREGARDGDRDGERREGARDGDRDGERRAGPRDGDRVGERRAGPRDGDRDGERREGARDGEKERRAEVRDPSEKPKVTRERD